MDPQEGAPLVQREGRRPQGRVCACPRVPQTPWGRRKPSSAPDPWGLSCSGKEEGGLWGLEVPLRRGRVTGIWEPRPSPSLPPGTPHLWEGLLWCLQQETETEGPWPSPGQCTQQGHSHSPGGGRGARSSPRPTASRAANLSGRLHPDSESLGQG